MPIETQIWRIEDKPKKVVYSSIQSEEKLEQLIEEDMSLVEPGLILLGRQVPTAFGKFVDLLAIDGEGHLVIIELKRNKTSREVVAQALDYASWAESLVYQDVIEIWEQTNPGRRFEEAFADRFAADPPDVLNESHRMVIVASELDPSTERIIRYLSSGYGVPLNAALFRYFKDGSADYLARSWLIDPTHAEVQSDRAKAARSGKEPWNGRDFYVSFGEGERRAWSDAVKYGFVSAGGGTWYSGTLSLLSPGARVFVCIPKTGYVGVGIVREASTKVDQFTLDFAGRQTRLLDLPLDADMMGEDQNDPDKAEYVVGIDWIRTLPADSAIWEKGMFANQNSACKLRNRFTIERLSHHFGLADEPGA